MTEKKIVGRECKFAIHIPSKNGYQDYHLVKERIHYEDGTQEPNVRYIKNFERTFGVTKKPYQNHKQKKESEEVGKLIVHRTTQSEIDRSVRNALGMSWSNARLRQLTDSPFLYGTDISSTAIIKEQYQRKDPDLTSDYTIAFGDIETDVVHGTDDPIITSMTVGDELRICVDRDFLSNVPNAEDRFLDMLEEHLGDQLKEHGIKPSIKIVDGPIELLKSFIHPLHDDKPDFLAFWNMDFDVPRILDTCKKYEYDDRDLFCDPKLPKGLRLCRYRKGSTQKRISNGQVKPMNPSEQWHSLLVPASFYIIDPMSSYRFIRQGSQEESSYSLDHILNKILGRGKVRIGSTEDGDGLAWHIEMQTKYKIEYLVYAAFDTLGMYLLEKRTKDLSSTLPIQAGVSDFSDFSRQSKRFADDYHFFLRGEGEMIQSVPPMVFDDNIEEDPLDKEGYNTEDDDIEDDEEPLYSTDTDVLSLRGWIVNLKPHLSMLGLNGILEDDEALKTFIRFFTYDSDAVSAYPSCVSGCNVSLATTVFEIITINSRREEVFRHRNLDLLQGHVNALEYGVDMFHMPKVQDTLELFADM